MHPRSVMAVAPGFKRRFDQAVGGKQALKMPDGERDKKTVETLQAITDRTLCSVCGDAGHWHSNLVIKSYEETKRKKDQQKRGPETEELEVQG